MWMPSYSCFNSPNAKQAPVTPRTHHVASNNFGTMEYPRTHQVVVPPYEIGAPDTAQEHPQLIAPTWHDVPLCPQPYATKMDQLVLITRSLPLTSWLHILPCMMDSMCDLTLLGLNNYLLRVTHWIIETDACRLNVNPQTNPADYTLYLS